MTHEITPLVISLIPGNAITSGPLNRRSLKSTCGISSMLMVTPPMQGMVSTRGVRVTRARTLNCTSEIRSGTTREIGPSFK